MSAPSHATLASFDVDLTRGAEQRVGVEQMIVPEVQRHPGFVADTWTLDCRRAGSYVMLAYQSFDSATEMPANIIGGAEAREAVGNDLVEVRVLDVSAAAAAGAS